MVGQEQHDTVQVVQLPLDRLPAIVPLMRELCGGRRVVRVFAEVIPDGPEVSGQRSESSAGKVAGEQAEVGVRPVAGAELSMEILREMREELEKIRHEIALVRNEHRDLRAAKERLAAMHGEGLFAFAKYIDQEAREQFMAVMASGDVAKAARELSLKDSTLRSKLEKWPKRGKAYAALAEIIRWRKSIKGQAGMEFAKRVASGAERDVDFPALIRDVVEELEELDPENWEERCGNLAEALRKAVS